LKVRQSRNIEKEELHFEKVFLRVKSMLNAKIIEISAKVSGDFSGAPLVNYPNIYLESIFLNLLSNSLKYHDPSRLPEISFKSYFRDNRTVLEVADNGLGINLEKYGQHLFKLRKVFHRHPESRGVGLFLVKNQVETMGGEITVKSTENTGTTFFINFDKHS
jgi:signal transduction histidine kinase